MDRSALLERRFGCSQGSRFPLVLRDLRRDWHVEEPADAPSEQVELIDGLAGPPLPKLGRPICCTDDERHTAVVSLDDRWVIVRSGGAGATDQHDGHPRSPSEPERMETCHSLVDLDPERHSDGFCAQHKRGRPTARRHHRVVHAQRTQLGEESETHRIGITRCGRGDVCHPEMVGP